MNHHLRKRNDILLFGVRLTLKGKLKQLSRFKGLGPRALKKATP
ncbi:MAG: hypothetical protein ACI88H_003875, partial [Cocleimonas sp.]